MQENGVLPHFMIDTKNRERGKDIVKKEAEVKGQSHKYEVCQPGWKTSKITAYAPEVKDRLRSISPLSPTRVKENTERLYNEHMKISHNHQELK